MTAAAAITAEFGHNLQTGNEDSLSSVSTSRRGRTSGSDSEHLSTIPNGRRRSAPRNVGRSSNEKLSSDILEPPFGHHCHSNNSLSTARRDFFQGPSEVSETKKTPDRRRLAVSDTSSGYASNSSGIGSESEAIEGSGIPRDPSSTESVFACDGAASSCPESPEARGAIAKYGNGTAFSSPSSSSSANSPTFSSGASLGGGLGDLKSTYTDEILKVLEEDGLILQACPRDNPSPLPASVSERRASADYNVIELSRQYRKKELSQIRASDKFQLITDTYRLKQMLESTDDEDKRRVIRQRIIELKSGIRNKENGHVNGPRMRSLSTREMVETHSASGERKYSGFGSPIKDPSMLGGIAALTLPNFHGSAGSTPASPAANGHKSITPISQTTKIIARTPAEIKAALLRWCQIKTRGYPNVLITNFTKSWADGMAFCALIHHFFPQAFDFSMLDAKNRQENFDLAFRLAEEMAGIVPLLDVDDMISMGDNPEYKCIYTYVQSMYKNLHALE